MKPLTGRTIIITRDSLQAGNLRDMLETLGATVTSIPTISISDPPDWLPFDSAVEQIETFHWVVFTSINAVSQTRKRLEQLGQTVQSFRVPRIAAVGDKTAQQVAELGWQVEFIPEQFQAEGLAAGLVDRGVSHQKIWFPRAMVARHVLIDELVKTGAEVVVTPVYQNTIPWQNKTRLQATLDNDHLDWITFTSSSTVINFFKILDREPASVTMPKIASIGSITTKTLLELSLKPEFTADPQNLEGFVPGYCFL